MKNNNFAPKNFPLSEEDYQLAMRDSVARLDMLMAEALGAWNARKPNNVPEDTAFLEIYRTVLESKMELLGLFPEESSQQEEVDDWLEQLGMALDEEDWDDDEDPATTPKDSRANLKIVKGPTKKK